MPRFRRWHLIPAALLLLAGLHGGVWLAAGWHLRAALDDLARPDPGQPWRVEHGAVRTAGWPLAATLEIADLRLVNAGRRITVRITGARASLGLRHPGLTVIALAGPITVESEGERAADITATRAEGHVGLVAPHAATLFVRGLRVTTATGPLGTDRLDLRATPGPAATAGDIALTLDASAEGIEFGGLAPALRGPLGTRITSAALNATLSGPIDLRLPSPAHVARTWRNAGGVLTLNALDLQWSRLDVNLQATLGLSPTLQPEGSGTAGAGGIAETLDRAVGEGMLPASTARAAKAVIGLMPQTPDGKISIPLSLKGQMLSAARFPLMRVPELQWP